jgi:hypothetical protein
MAADCLVADTLGIPILHGGDDKKEILWGSGRKTFQFGPFDLPIFLQTRSAVVKENRVCMWVSFTDSLWGYLDLSYNSTKLAFFNAQEVGITVENCKDFAFAEVQTKVKAIFEYTSQKNKWSKIS